jgi:hypothetical protein
MLRRSIVLGLVAVAIIWPAAASAHKYELGISIEPAFFALPAVANENTKNTLALSAGGGLGFECYVLNELAVIVRGGYTHAFATSLIGEATFTNGTMTRTGNYYFQQSAAYASGGVRLETPSYWLPVSFFASVTGGVVFLPQTQRVLIDAVTGNSALPDTLKILPTVVASVGVAVRVTNQIRLQAEPLLYIVPVAPVLVGYGASIGITFLFYP